MAQRQTKSRSRGKATSNGGRRASDKDEKYQFAQNLAGDATKAELEYRRYSGEDDQMEDPDVLLDVPVVKVDSIHFELDELDAHVALQAKVLDLVKLNVGVDVHLGKVKLDIKGVEAQALAKIRLDYVAAVVDRVLTTIDRNPELIKSLGKTVEEVGSEAGQTLGKTGDAVKDVGQGAQGAVQDVGQGAGQAVGDVGEGAGQAVGDIGEGAGQAVQGVGEGAGQGVGQLGQGAGQAAGGLLGGGQQGGGQQGGGLGEAVGGLGGAVGGAGGAAGGLADGAGGGSGVAKQVAKQVAKELGSTASEEAKELGMAAARKAQELADRRRQKRADKHNATEAALRLAHDLGIDVEELEGSGAEGRVTVKDVRAAAED
jgi:pyruvate/2-oxoglutarate dehydrogenase complex dihydrolipoamide acyltransferase (E2) component